MRLDSSGNLDWEGGDLGFRVWGLGFMVSGLGGGGGEKVQQEVHY